MSIFNHKDFEIEIQVETSNDDLIYGNYVEWDLFRQEQWEEILSVYEIILPWGKSLSLEEHDELIKDLSESLKIEDIYTFENEFSQFLELPQTIPSTNDILQNDLLTYILDCLGVPSGTEYEKELPEEYQYWSAKNQLSDFDYYLHLLGSRSYEQVIHDLQKRFEDEIDPLLKKAFVLTAMITSEALIKKSLQPTLKKDEYCSLDKMKTLFNDIYSTSVPDMSWTSARNSLAHNIESSLLDQNDTLFYDFKNGSYQKMIDCRTIFEDLTTFGNKIKEIIAIRII